MRFFFIISRFGETHLLPFYPFIRPAAIGKRLCAIIIVRRNTRRKRFMQWRHERVLTLEATIRAKL